MADINLGVGGANSASGGYDIDNSVVLNRQDNETLQYTFSSAATNLKKNTLSIWFKRNELDNNQGLYQFGVDGSTDNTYIRFVRERFNGSQISFRGKLGGTSYTFLGTTARFRDTSAWYHLVVVWDTTHSTGSERLHLYLNGEKQTSYSTDNRSTIPQNQDTPNGENGKFVLIGEGVYDMSTYVAETHFVDGQALTASDFGEFDSDSGIWKPKEYTGTYGNNGFWLKFDNSANMGLDSSGNSNNWTTSGTIIQNKDTPSNSFATLNPSLDVNNGMILSNAGSTAKGWDSGNHRFAGANPCVSSGKYYYEVKVTKAGSSPYCGIIDAQSTLRRDNVYFVGSASGVNDSGYAVNMSGDIYHNNSSTYATSIGSISTGDILGFAVDLDSAQRITHEDDGDRLGETDRWDYEN